MANEGVIGLDIGTTSTLGALIAPPGDIIAVAARSTTLSSPHPALADDASIKIGVLATFEGPFTVLGEDGMRGAMTAVDEVGGRGRRRKMERVARPRDCYTVT